MHANEHGTCNNYKLIAKIRSKKHAKTKTRVREREKHRERDLKRETIAVLVEEAEGLLELGDLVVGELVGHWRRERGVWGARK